MREKYLILFCVIILTALCFFYFSTINIKANSKKIVAYDKRIKIEQEKLNSAKVLNEQLQEVSKVIVQSMTKEAEFTPDEVNSFIKKIADLADRYKIAVHSIFPKVISTTRKNLIEQQYTLILNCTFIQMGQFLSELESFDHIINIKTLDVSPLRKDKKKGINDVEDVALYKITLELSTFKIIKEV
ncbi:MAG: type 4a pilus biogenesis protein PilO [Candidatus Cloacimonetes bacterium]|nr:type 4a pilus biogenesis protein PilO [Candidatus Cloacimonadota bacterium]